MVLALLLGETLTGIVTNNDVADEGPLTELMPAWLANGITDLHGRVWRALAVALHLAIAVYAAPKGQNLLAPMLTGTKRLAARSAAPRVVSPVLALPVLALAVAAAVRAGRREPVAPSQALSAQGSGRRK